ncbi:YtpR family tRNA-binding protein [Amphibacillus marinus]|nr:DUF4479 family protein [Amphibacillus marinus]
MELFYNKAGIGDVLILPLKQGDRDRIDYRTYNDVTEIFDKENNQILGYNIFNISQYIEIDTGSTTLDEGMLERINHVFLQNNVPDALKVDLSPKFVIGYVNQVEKHENADKLNVCQVDLGDEVVQIVCGAPNVAADQYVVVAKVGAIMPSGLEIKEANLRGVDSFGMICSQKELALPNAPVEKGIYVIAGDVKAGDPFRF